MSTPPGYSELSDRFVEAISVNRGSCRRQFAAVLLWKYKGRILDYYLGSPEFLENLQDFSETSVSSVRTEVLCKPQTVPLQAALF